MNYVTLVPRGSSFAHPGTSAPHRPVIRLTCCHRPAHAGRYFRLHLAAGDAPGQALRADFLRARWVGSALPLVDLAPATPPRASHLVRLGRGLHPTHRLRLAPAVNRTRAYYDLTIAAPKSVSLAALLRPDHPTARRVLDAHVRAVQALAAATAGLLRPRNGPGPGQWLGVVFTHTHTREGDPHLHSHLVIPNVMRNARGEWRALQIVIAGQGRRRLGLLYGHELARHLRAADLGPELVVRANGLPELRSFRPLSVHFSRSRQAVLRAHAQAEEERTRQREKRRQEEASKPAAAGTATSPPPPRSTRVAVAVDPRRAAWRRRQRLADRLRRVKPKGADDPATLETEARRWSAQLSNSQLRAVLRALDGVAGPRDGSGTTGGRRVRVLHELPTPASVAACVRAAFSRLALAQGTVSGPELLTAAVRASAGRHPWEELRRACRRAVAARDRRWAELMAAEFEEVPRLAAEMARLPATVRVTPVRPFAQTTSPEQTSASENKGIVIRRR